MCSSHGSGRSLAFECATVTVEPIRNSQDLYWSREFMRQRGAQNRLLSRTSGRVRYESQVEFRSPGPPPNETESDRGATRLGSQIRGCIGPAISSLIPDRITDCRHIC
jgi:hypothetical protein